VPAADGFLEKGTIAVVEKRALFHPSVENAGTPEGLAKPCKIGASDCSGREEISI
jgi:hypothetical protein